jgi:hypothetical protein
MCYKGGDPSVPYLVVISLKERDHLGDLGIDGGYYKNWTKNRVWSCGLLVHDRAQWTPQWTFEFRKEQKFHQHLTFSFSERTLLLAVVYLRSIWFFWRFLSVPVVSDRCYSEYGFHFSTLFVNRNNYAAYRLMNAVYSGRLLHLFAALKPNCNCNRWCVGLLLPAH